MSSDMKELRDYEQYQIAHALASSYTSEQLTQALEIRRGKLANQQTINPFDTPLEEAGVCQPCTGACVTSDGTATCEDDD